MTSHGLEYEIRKRRVYDLLYSVRSKLALDKFLLWRHLLEDYIWTNDEFAWFERALQDYKQNKEVVAS